MNTTTFLSDQYKLFKAVYQVNPDASLLHVKVKKDCFNNIMISEENQNEMSVSKSVELHKATSWSETLRCLKK